MVGQALLEQPAAADGSKPVGGSGAKAALALSSGAEPHEAPLPPDLAAWKPIGRMVPVEEPSSAADNAAASAEADQFSVSLEARFGRLPPRGSSILHTLLRLSPMEPSATGAASGGGSVGGLGTLYPDSVGCWSSQPCWSS